MLNKPAILLRIEGYALLVASLLGAVLLIIVGIVGHYFEGPWRWFVIGATVLLWLIVSLATRMGAKEADEVEKQMTEWDP